MRGLRTQAKYCAVSALIILCGRSFADDSSGIIIDRFQCPTAPFDVSEILIPIPPAPSPIQLPSAIIAKDTNLSATFGISDRLMFPGFRANPMTWTPNDPLDSPSQHSKSALSLNADSPIRWFPTYPFTDTTIFILKDEEIRPENVSHHLAGFSIDTSDLSSDALLPNEFHLCDETVWELLSDFTRYLSTTTLNAPDESRQPTSNSLQEMYQSLCEFVLSHQDDYQSHLDTLTAHGLSPSPNESIKR